MSPDATAAGTSRSGPRWPGSRLYSVLLLAQFVGVAILLVNMIPLYRLMVLDFSSYTPDLRPSWAIVGILLIQVAYWLRVRLRPPLPRTRSVVLGHIVAFVARLGFVSVTAGFTVMFLNRFEALKDMNYSPLRTLVVLMIFFALFCSTQELERLAKALQEDDQTGGMAHRG